MIRRIKLAYTLYNLFHKKQLSHNIPLYRELGLRKKYYSSISSADFSGIDPESILMGSTLDSEKLSTIDLFRNAHGDTQTSILNFEKNGYCIIRNYLDQHNVNKINATIDSLRSSGQLKFTYGNKLMFAIRQSSYLHGIWADSSLKLLLDALIQGDATLFSSINFLRGSQQKSHSDSIHMTTFPLGGLLGVWMALEDIDEDNGPLHYYPKSHTLPYYLNQDYDNEGNRFLIGHQTYAEYEKMISSKIEAQGMKKQVFTAKRGDLLIWHANLIHGGEPQRDSSRTRQSMVLHYFDKNRVCYHEITQRPALLHKGM